MRSVHVVTRTGVTPYPSFVVAVHAKVRQQYFGEADDVGTLMLSEWYGVRYSVSNGVMEHEHEATGDSHDSFWRWLEDIGQCKSGVHIYSWQARDVVAALGLWDKLADQSYTLKRGDPLSCGDKASGQAAETDCYMVLEAPPTIIAFSPSDADRRFTWLDPQNYGIRTLAAYIDDDDATEDMRQELEGETLHNGCDPQMMAYAVVDFVQAYYRTIESLSLGGPQHTAASQAMHGFRHSGMKHRIEIHNSETVSKWERAALYGGRCEASFIGDLYAGPRACHLAGQSYDGPGVRYDLGPLYYLDVNSLYPSVAMDASLPVKLQGICGTTDVYNLLAACKAVGVIAVVQVKTDVPCVPLRLDDRTVYPVGVFDTVLCGPEILLASRCGARLKCRRMAVYQTAPIYSGWVRRLWECRQRYADSRNEQMRTVCKSILNASFGKWAQANHRWTDVPNQLPLRPYMQWWQLVRGGPPTQYRAIAWRVQRMDTREEEKSDSFPAITAYINSLARVRLFDLITRAGWDNVYYYDTDSLICTQEAFENLVRCEDIGPRELGKLKIVRQPMHVRIIGRQAYEMDGVLTISGAKGTLRKAGDSFAETLVAPPVGYYLGKGEAPGMERRIARVRTTRAYNLGNVMPDGRVLPIRF